MANWDQASKWLAQGKAVKRSAHLSLEHPLVVQATILRIDRNGFLVEDEFGYPVWMTLDAFKSEEWEIAG